MPQGRAALASLLHESSVIFHVFFAFRFFHIRGLEVSATWLVFFKFCNSADEFHFVTCLCFSLWSGIVRFTFVFHTFFGLRSGIVRFTCVHRFLSLRISMYVSHLFVPLGGSRAAAFPLFIAVSCVFQKVN